ncbi:MAG: hypothetical protein ACOYJ2_00955 [Rickettsiales bacterium]
MTEQGITSETRQLYGKIISDALIASGCNVYTRVRFRTEFDYTPPDRTDPIRIVSISGHDNAEEGDILHLAADTTGKLPSATAISKAIGQLADYGIVAQMGTNDSTGVADVALDMRQDGFEENMAAFQDSVKDKIIASARRVINSHYQQGVDVFHMVPRTPDGKVLIGSDGTNLAAETMTVQATALYSKAKELGPTAMHALRKAINPPEGRAIVPKSNDDT